MRYTQLGSSELTASAVCLGTMTFGEQNTETEAHEQLDFAWDRGVNCLDTAEMYAVPTRSQTQGLSESYVGTWLKARPRDSVLVFGKVTGPSPKPWIPPRRVPAQPAAPTRLTPESIRGAVQGSLKRLQTDYIDLIELHWPDRYVGTLFGNNRYQRDREQTDVVPFEDQVDALARLVEEGKIRAWGLSNETSYGLCRFHQAARALGAPLPATVQNDFSLLDRSVEPEIAEVIAPRNLNIALLVYGALNGGVLTGKYLDQAPPGARHTRWPSFQPRYHSPRAREAAARYAALAREHGVTPTELALGWTCSREYIASTIVGATRIEQLEECLAAADVTLSPELEREIERIHRAYPSPNKNSGVVSPGFRENVREGI